MVFGRLSIQSWVECVLIFNLQLRLDTDIELCKPSNEKMVLPHGNPMLVWRKKCENEPVEGIVISICEFDSFGQRLM